MSILARLRRYILQHLVPEFVWPPEITLDGIQFKVRGTPYSFGIKHLLTKRTNEYERPERVLLKYISRGDTVLELGSSIGIVTRCIAQRVGPEGKILAVEASEKLTSYSKQWLEEIPNIRVVNAYAFPIQYQVPVSFHFDDTHGSLGGTVVFDRIVDSKSEKEGFFIETAEKLYDIFPNVLVCDIEGSEIILLHENAKLPDYLNTILIELHPGIYPLDVALLIIQRIQQIGFNLETSLFSVYVFKRRKRNG